MTSKKNRHLSCPMLSFLYIHSKPSMNSNQRYSPETLNSGHIRRIIVPCDIQIWRMTLKNNRASHQYCFEICASFHSHQWVLTGDTVRKRPIRVKIAFFVPCDLDIWQIMVKKNRAPLLCYFKLCVSFPSHWWIQTSVTVTIWVKIDLSLATSSFVHHFIIICEFWS